MKMNIVQKALKHLENYELAEAFASLDALDLKSSDKPVYARLKKEFIAGKDDVDYLERLKIFIQNLDGEVKEKSKDSSQNFSTGESVQNFNQIQGSNNVIQNANLNNGSQINVGGNKNSLNNSKSIKTQIKDLLADLRMEEALNALSDELQNKDDRLWNEVIQCKANLKRLEIDRPTLSRQEANLEEAQIRKRIFWIIGELE